MLRQYRRHMRPSTPRTLDIRQEHTQLLIKLYYKHYDLAADSSTAALLRLISNLVVLTQMPLTAASS